MKVRSTVSTVLSTIALAVASQCAVADVPSMMNKVGAHDQYHSAEYNPTGEPIGGGAGYNDIVDAQASGLITVASADFASLKSAVDAAGNSSTAKTVYVPDGFEIDMTGQLPLKIPANVTLASGRGNGNSQGAMLYITSNRASAHYAPILLTGGENVKITGLRIRGVDGSRLSNAANLSTGIAVIHHDAEVSNNEIYNFNHAGVYATTEAQLYKAEPAGSFETEKKSRAAGDDLHLHHNFIHNNYGAGQGYGITVSAVEVLVEGNYFNYGRHAVASTGIPGSAYEVRFNVFGKRFEFYPIDMHGGADSNDGSNDAGDWAVVHHNTFYWTQQYTGVPTSSPGGIHFSGQPRQGAWVFNNWYDSRNIQLDQNDGVTQIVPMDPTDVSDAMVAEVPEPHLTSFRKNIYSYQTITTSLNPCTPNCYVYAPGEMIANDIYEYNNRTGRATWGQVTPVTGESTKVGDFDGDGLLDLLTIQSDGHFKVQRRMKGAGYGSPLSWYVNDANDTLDVNSFKVGDFNGDGKADLLSIDGGKLQVWLAGTFSFGKVAGAPSYASTTEASHIRIGDFDGLYGADVVTFDKNNDFTVFLSDGNGNLAAGTKWGANGGYIADGNRYRIADVNGDGRSDIVSFEHVGYYVWSAQQNNQFSGVGQWGSNGAALAPTQYHVGYANGDAKVDVISFESNGGRYQWTSNNNAFNWFGEWFYSWYWSKYDSEQAQWWYN